MSLIRSAAFFQVCECGHHGHIRFSDGSVGLEVCSITSGLQELKEAQESNRLIKEECPELKRQILTSGFVNQDKDAHHVDMLCAELINRAKDFPEKSDEPEEPPLVM